MPSQKKSKRAPWKARVPREAHIISLEREKMYLSAQDLIKHNRRIASDTELIGMRDIQYDHADILTYQTEKEIEPTSYAFLEGSAEDNDLQNRPGNNYIDGKEGNVAIFGMEGNDYISGRAGIDTLTSGTSADYFQLDPNPTPEKN